MSTRPFTKSRPSIYISISRFFCLIESVKLCTFVRQASFQAQPSSPLSLINLQATGNRHYLPYPHYLSLFFYLSAVPAVSPSHQHNICRSTCKVHKVQDQVHHGIKSHSLAHSGCSLLEMIQHPKVCQLCQTSNEQPRKRLFCSKHESIISSCCTCVQIQ